MTIAIRGRPLDQGLRTRVVQQLRATLGRLAVEPVAAQATFFDENGPKGGVALRCALTVRLPYRLPIRVDETAINARLAFGGWCRRRPGTPRPSPRPDGRRRPLDRA